MPCKLDKDCVFSNQKPECERVQICCEDKLAVKDAEIASLTAENANYLHHMHEIQREFMETINRLRQREETRKIGCLHRMIKAKNDDDEVRLCMNEECNWHGKPCRSFRVRTCSLADPIGELKK
jgi:hypothetical protein